MTPSIPKSDLEKFVQESGWSPDIKAKERVKDDHGLPDEDHVIVYAYLDQIRIIDLDGKDYGIARRQNFVTSLCPHEGELYDGGNYMRIYMTMNDKLIGKRTYPITAMCSHQGSLYDNGKAFSVIDTFSKEEIAQRSTSVEDLCSHKEILIDISMRSLFDTLADKRMDHLHIGLKKHHMIEMLHSYQGRLYASSNGGIFLLEEGREVATREDKVKAMCTHNGRLIDGGKYQGIHDTFTSDIISDTPLMVHAMCSHPRQYFVEWGVLPP